ncbi:MAG: hypothetical protein Q8Q01_05645 [archaeon]|nr:hypothetical protein [archaeon]
MDWRNITKMQAENNYAVGITYLREGKSEIAREYAINAVQLYELVNVETLEDAAPTRMRVLGIELPDIMHQDVVKKRFGLENEQTK